MNADVRDFKQNLRSSFEPRSDQILDDFLLRIDRNPPSRELFEVDSMTGPTKAQFHSIVNQAFPVHALAHSHFSEQFDGALLENSGANPFFAILAAASLHNDRLDPL